MFQPEDTHPPEAAEGGGGPARPADPGRRLVYGLTVSALSLLILTLVYLMLRELADILQPLFIAVFMCYLIIPAHRWLVRKRIPSFLSYLCIVVLIVGAVLGFGRLVYGSLADMTERMPAYQEKLDPLIRRVASSLPAGLQIPGFTAPAETDREPDADAGADAASGEIAAGTDTGQQGIPAAAPPQSYIELIPELINFERVAALASSTLGTFLGFWTTLIIVIFYLFFLLAEGASFERRLHNAFEPARADRIIEIFTTINGAIAQYIVAKTFISLLIATIASGILWAFGVDFFIMWGMLTFFANFIPYVGSIVAVSLPIGLSFLQFDSYWVGVSLAVLLGTAQQLTGNFLEPRIIGKRLDLSPVMILLSLAFWGSLWGIVGMVLSVPLLVSLRIALENVPETRPLARIISNV